MVSRWGRVLLRLPALFIPKADFTTPGTYELADLVDLQSNLPADQGTLTIAATQSRVPKLSFWVGWGLG